MSRRVCLYITAMIVCFLSLGGVRQAFAEVPEEIVIDEENQYSVAIFPQSIPIYLFKGVAPDANVNVTELRGAMIRQANRHPYLRVISKVEIEQSFNRSDAYQADTFMQAEIDMGYVRSFMDGMNYESAREILKRIIGNYQKAYIQYYRPEAVAQAWQTLAYATIAQIQDSEDEKYEEISSARLAFLELIRLAPYLTMLEGRQSPERVRLYDEALDLFLNNEAYRQTPQKDAAALAHKIHADILVLPRIVGDRDGHLYLEVDEYQSKTDEMHYHRQILDFPMDHRDEYVADVISQILSDSYDCLKVTPEVEKSEDYSHNEHFSLEFGVMDSTHLRHPTQRYLNSLGGWIAFSYVFDPHVFFRAGGVMQSVVQDKAHELYANFELYQIPIQVGVKQSWEYGSIYIMAGPNFSFTTSYTISSSTICKTFGIDDVECDPKRVTTNQQPFALIMEITLGGSVGHDPFFVLFEAMMGVTAWPDSNADFKHPLGGRVGIQYWF